jgi:hypothetical protein
VATAWVCNSSGLHQQHGKAATWESSNMGEQQQEIASVLSTRGMMQHEIEAWDCNMRLQFGLQQPAIYEGILAGIYHIYESAWYAEYETVAT